MGILAPIKESERRILRNINGKSEGMTVARQSAIPLFAARNPVFESRIRIIIPTPDAIQITGAALVVDDEGNDAMPEAFFEHDQAAYASVAILIRMDTLKLYMEVQYVLKVNRLLGLVLLN